MKQYEIRWANLPKPIGRRPVLLLSRTPAYSYLSKAIVAEITTNIRAIPQEINLGKREGLLEFFWGLQWGGNGNTGKRKNRSRHHLGI